MVASKKLPWEDESAHTGVSYYKWLVELFVSVVWGFGLKFKFSLFGIELLLKQQFVSSKQVIINSLERR